MTTAHPGPGASGRFVVLGCERRTGWGGVHHHRLALWSDGTVEAAGPGDPPGGVVGRLSPDAVAVVTAVVTSPPVAALPARLEGPRTTSGASTTTWTLAGRPVTVTGDPPAVVAILDALAGAVDPRGA